MLHYRRPSTRAICAIFGAAVLCLGIAAGRAAPWAHAASPSASTLKQQIGAAKNRASGLAGAVHAAGGRVAQLDSSIGGLQHRISSIQSALVYERHQLLTSRALRLSAEKRLHALEATERDDGRVLANRLVSTYETPPPEIINVIVEAHGFADMLEQLAFARRIQDQDTHVATKVRSARSAVAEQATVLGALEARQQTLTDKIVAQRSGLYNARLQLVQQRLVAARKQSAASSQLASTRHAVAALQRQLIKLQVDLATAQQHQQSSSSASSSGPVSPSQTSSAAGFTFPLPRGSVSPPSTWSLDQGVDISAPAHTPELAVGAGTIVLHGIGGFGPWAPVLHLDSGGYVYYGHAGPGNELPIGTHVSAGQTIAEIGAGIVGISSGPHLEIGFCDASGTPLGPQTAPQMMSLLQASY
jgi:murein DD-endopeptidase MepM/ murein hydrolase activator NlpD